MIVVYYLAYTSSYKVIFMNIGFSYISLFIEECNSFLNLFVQHNIVHWQLNLRLTDFTLWKLIQDAAEQNVMELLFFCSVT